jgi:hypothetical protein
MVGKGHKMPGLLKRKLRWIVQARRANPFAKAGPPGNRNLIIAN